MKYLLVMWDDPGVVKVIDHKDIDGQDILEGIDSGACDIYRPEVAQGGSGPATVDGYSRAVIGANDETETLFIDHWDKADE